VLPYAATSRSNNTKEKCTYVVPGEVMDIGLAKHGVVLELGFSQWGCISSDNHELCLARSQTLEG
jgi:hypothetical protein